jgi:hypothetical protein
MTSASLIGNIALTYAVVGVGIALAFVASGAERVLPQPASFTLGARLMLVPGAAILWPYVLIRWLGARRRR